MADVKKAPRSASAPRPTSWLLRRADQAAVAGLVVCALVGMAAYWFANGGHRGELIEIDRADPLTARYMVDVNNADWPENTSLKLLADLVFKASDLPEPPFDHRATPGIDRAAELLQCWLAGGPLAYREVMKRVGCSGLSKSTFDRAKRRLAVEHDGGEWTLALHFDYRPSIRKPPAKVEATNGRKAVPHV